jgi:hypothetical protein
VDVKGVLLEGFLGDRKEIALVLTNWPKPKDNDLSDCFECHVGSVRSVKRLGLIDPELTYIRNFAARPGKHPHALVRLRVFGESAVTLFKFLIADLPLKSASIRRGIQVPSEGR